MAFGKARLEDQTARRVGGCVIVGESQTRDLRKNRRARALDHDFAHATRSERAAAAERFRQTIRRQGGHFRARAGQRAGSARESAIGRIEGWLCPPSITMMRFRAGSPHTMM